MGLADASGEEHRLPDTAGLVRIAPVALPALALGLGALLLGRRSLTVDEMDAVSRVSGPFGDVVADALDHDPGIVGYIAALDGTVELLGNADWAPRTLSVAATVLSVTLAWAVGRRLLGSSGGALAALFFVTSAAVVTASQQARPHALATTAVLASTWLLLHAADRGGALRWAAYAVAAAFLPLTHPVAASALIAHGAMLAARRNEVRLAHAIPAFAFALVECALFLAASAVDRDALGSLPGPTGREIAEAVLSAAGDNPLLLGLGIAGVVVLALGLVQSAERWTVWLVGGLLVGPFLLLLAAGLAMSVRLEPALVVAMPGIALGAAAAVLAIPRPALAWVVVGVTVTASIALTGRWYAEDESEDWRAAAAALQRSQAPDETVLVLPPRAAAALEQHAPDVTTTRVARGAGAWVLVQGARGDGGAVNVARTVVDTPRYALLRERRLGSNLVLQHWVRP